VINFLNVLALDVLTYAVVTRGGLAVAKALTRATR